MPIVKVLPHPQYCPDGAEMIAQEGMSLCEVLLLHQIPIDHRCDMNCACATCHVIVRQGFDTLADPQDRESDLLDRAWGLRPCSRLSCQAIVAQHDLVVEIPRYSVNQS